jgi:ATP/maltotriose-dependent transcriptional regulator MalT
VLLNLSDALGRDDPAASARAARSAVVILRRTGHRSHLTIALLNLVVALLSTGDWNEVASVLADHLIEADGLAGSDLILCHQAWFAALRGDGGRAQVLLDGVSNDLRHSEDPQSKAIVALARAFTALALGEHDLVQRYTGEVLEQANALGISGDSVRWAWPLAARVAQQAGDDHGATAGLLAMLDSYDEERMPPMLTAERELVQARALADQGSSAAADVFSAAINDLRAQSTPYHLANGLLDHAEYLSEHGALRAAKDARAEALVIGQRLHCQPLVARAARLQSVIAFVSD